MNIIIDNLKESAIQIYDILKKADPNVISKSSNTKNSSGDNVQIFVEILKRQNRSIRLAACFVTEVHRILQQGGIFLYPTDKKCPSGKLRLLYECFPMSFIIENAGGISLDTINNILDKEIPNKLHERSPIILGSKKDVELYKTIYNLFNLQV